MDRTERLLKVGYFPTQLPPAFSTQQFGLIYAPLLIAWASPTPTRDGGPEKAPAGKVEIFSVARAGHRRRATGITNPIGQAYLANSIAKHWGGILKHYRMSKLSASRPRIQHDGDRAGAIPSMKLHAEATLHRSAGYMFALRTDVSRFFPTIYTHSIPWALHGKAAAKSNRHNRTTFYGNVLDEASRQLQDGQTIGLPIGPDTSHIIAEIVATAIDVELMSAISVEHGGFRYVDDYYLFFHSRADAESALASITKSLRNYELQINFEKTQICETVALSDDFWSHQLRLFAISDSGKSQARDIHYFFELAKKLAKENTDESVMLYAVKRASSTVIRPENWKGFMAQLCHVAIAFPNTLQQVARILATYRGVGYPMASEFLKRMLNSLIREHAPLEHHSEVAWCLWMCKALDVKLNQANVPLVAEMRSSVCALILLDLSNSGKLEAAPVSSLWATLHAAEELYGEMWLLCYEAGMRAWGGFSRVGIDSDRYYSKMAERDVHFYFSEAATRPIFTVDTAAVELRKGSVPADIHELFEDDDVDEYLEFDNDPGGYGHVAHEQEEEDEDEDVEDDEEDEEDEGIDAFSHYHDLTPG